MRCLAPILCIIWAISAAFAQPISSAPQAPFGPADGGVAEIPVPVAWSSLSVRFRPPVPAYPLLARIVNIQGTVVLRLTVGAKGEVELVQATGGPLPLRGPAEAFLRQWQFEPVVVGGKPARVQCELDMPFRLQDEQPRAPDSQPRKVVVEIAQVPSSGSVPIALAALQGEVRDWLTRNGLSQVSEAEAGPADTIHLKLEIQAFQTRDKIYLCQVQERCSLWEDRHLKESPAGKPLRLAYLGHVMGQKGDTGFQELLLSTLQRTLGELLALAPVRPRTEASKGPLALAQPKALDFQFSQIRVKRRPPVPAYPAHAKAAGVQGTVVVELTIDPQGTPVNAEAVSGPAELLLTAVRYGLSWEFEPARLNGTPQYARFRLTMPFRLWGSLFPPSFPGRH